MEHQSYFHCLVDKTPTTWWHDSADIEELEQALHNHPDYWRTFVQILPKDLDGEARIEAMMQIVVTEVAKRLF